MDVKSITEEKLINRPSFVSRRSFGRAKEIQLSPIKEMELRASAMTDVVSLAQGIPSFQTPLPIRNFAIQAIKRGVVSKYSLAPGMPELREVLAQHLAKEGIEIDFEKELIITCGAMGALSASLLAILFQGDEVIIPSPVYASYVNLVKVAGGVPVYVPLNEENGWALDVSKIEHAITPKTRVIFFCNPNNPTGTIYSKSQLLNIVDIAKKNNLFILTDEVYKDFLFESDEYFSLGQCREFQDFVIRVTSFSKAYAMTGWRIGYLHTSEKNISQILKVSDTLVTCAPVISQYAALAALELGQAYPKKFSGIFQRRRELICRELDTLPHIFSYQRPTSAYFVFPKMISQEKNSREFCIDLLEQAKVALVPGSAFGPSGEYHVRMSFSRDDKDIKKAFMRMRSYFGSRKKETISL